MPAATASVLASPAPATPRGWPVSQPAIRMGASSAFSSTVAICTIIVGFTTPVPRRPEIITMFTYCSASPGRNQAR